MSNTSKMIQDRTIPTIAYRYEVVCNLSKLMSFSVTLNDRPNPDVKGKQLSTLKLSKIYNNTECRAATPAHTTVLPGFNISVVVSDNATRDMLFQIKQSVK